MGVTCLPLPKSTALCVGAAPWQAPQNASAVAVYTNTAVDMAELVSTE